MLVPIPPSVLNLASTCDFENLSSQSEHERESLPQTCAVRRVADAEQGHRQRKNQVVLRPDAVVVSSRLWSVLSAWILSHVPSCDASLSGREVQSPEPWNNQPVYIASKRQSPELG